MRRWWALTYRDGTTLSRYHDVGTPGEQVRAMFEGEGASQPHRIRVPKPLVVETLAPRAEHDPAGFELDMAQFGGNLVYRFVERVA